MPRMVIEVPEEFTEVGKAMAGHLAALQRTVSRLGGGKAVDYAAIEQEMAEGAGRTEPAGHRAILQSLDIDVPAVMIGGVRYTRVGRCEAPYHTMAGSVSVERSLYRQSGERGGHPGGRVVDAVSLRAGVVGDGWLPHAARAMAHAVQQGPSRGSGSERTRVWPPAVFARRFRAGGASGRGTCRCGSPGHRGRPDRCRRGAGGGPLC